MQITIPVFFFQMPVVAPVASVEPSEGADVRADDMSIEQRISPKHRDNIDLINGRNDILKLN